jgi:hypothetical protein
MYINFIQSFSSNPRIKINFDSKMLLCKFLNFLLVFKITKGCHQDFNLLNTMIFTRHHFFGKEWFTLSVFSLF